MKSLSIVLAAIALTACAGDRAIAPAAPAPSQTATFVRSVGANKAPLVFLDGKEITTEGVKTLDALDSRTIESVEVLKGAKALELYGARAANGVIFISSKR